MRMDGERRGCDASTASIEHWGLIRNPKPNPMPRGRASAWYEYYAGYSEDFVSDSLVSLRLPVGSRIADPWNGSGTTTAIARLRGYAAVGFDVNPALVVVAKGRILDRQVLPSLAALTADTLKKARARHRNPVWAHPDPLLRWFVPDTAASFRSIEKAIYALTIDPTDYLPLAQWKSLGGLSTLSAFLYVALFRTVRGFLGKFRTSNPTWITGAGAVRRRVRLEDRVVGAAFRESVKELTSRMSAVDGESSLETPETQLDVAASDNLPIDTGSVDAVISSPPYCTRIDYVVATMPELAVIGCGSPEEIRALRSRMLGTPIVMQAKGTADASWGDSCARFLALVHDHRSKASSTYYYQCFQQYFAGISRSLSETRRVLASKGFCVLVVQDSFYKEIHNPLPTILSEMAVVNGLRPVTRVDFPVARTRASMHPGTRKYRNDFRAVESLLVLQA